MRANLPTGFHPLPGVRINLDAKDRDSQENDTIEILGKSLALQGQSKTRDYILGYIMNEEDFSKE